MAVNKFGCWPGFQVVLAWSFRALEVRTPPLVAGSVPVLFFFFGFIFNGTRPACCAALLGIIIKKSCAAGQKWCVFGAVSHAKDLNGRGVPAAKKKRLGSFGVTLTTVLPGAGWLGQHCASLLPSPPFSKHWAKGGRAVPFKVINSAAARPVLSGTASHGGRPNGRTDGVL